MRLEKIQFYLNENKKLFQYTECENLGSIDLEYHGVSYHIWEFYDGEYGVESNVENVGKQVDYYGNYEQSVIDILKGW